jgi:hypothetical protein
MKNFKHMLQKREQAPKCGKEQRGRKEIRKAKKLTVLEFVIIIFKLCQSVRATLNIIN